MAAAVVKGVGLASRTIATGHQLGATMSTVSNIQKKKSSAIGGLSIFYGFVPINPVVWAFQMPLLIVLVLICAFFFEFSWKSSFLIAYVTQAIIVAYFYNMITSALSSIFLGI